MNENIINLIIQAKNLSSNALNQVKGQLADLSKSSEKTGNMLAGMGDNFKKAVSAVAIGAGIMGGAIAGISVVGFNTAASFQTQMSSISALTGATARDMDEVRKVALKAGEETAFSALEAAQGLEELLKAGLNIEQAKTGLKGALDLAAAGGIGVADAAEIASTALNAFKNDSLSVAQASDILAGAANASATSVGELKFGLSAASAVTSAVGMSFKDTNTALALFAQNGLKGSDAGTSLKTMFLNLQPATKAQYGLFKQLNLITKDGANQFFTAEGKVKSLAEISGVLKNALKDQTDQQRLASLEVLFGSDAIRAANILYKEGADGVNNMAGAMSKFTAADVAKEKLNNFNGVLDAFKGSLETKQIEIFSKALPLATDAIKWMDEALKKIDVEAVFTDLGNKFNYLKTQLETTKKWVEETAGVVQNLLVKGFFDLIKIIKDFLAPEIQTLNSIWNNFIEIVKSLWNNLQPLIAIIYILATQALQAVFYAFEQLRQPLNDFIQAIFNIARPIIDILAPAFVFIVGLISTLLIPTFQLVWAIVVQAFKGILQIITGVINTVSGILNVFIGIVKGIFTGDFSQAAEGFKQLWKGLEEFLKGIIDLILSPIRGIIDGIKNIFGGFDLAKIGVDMMDNLADGLWGAVDIAMGPINWLMDQVNAVLGKQSQAEANAYKSSQPVSGKGSVSQYGFAKGGAFQGGNVVAFADGGVVNKPTNFAMSGGRLGLMGEAGAEAIMPLSRGKDGKLGVKAEGGGATIIINNPTFLSGDENTARQFVKSIEDQLFKSFQKFSKI